MPKAKPRMTAKEQSAAFKREAQRRIDAGELNPINADVALDDLVRKSGKITASEERVRPTESAASQAEPPDLE